MSYIIKNGIAYAGNAVTVTQAQYDALSEAEKKNGTVYYIYDSDALLDASDVSYDNTSSGLSAANTQAAIDEISSDVESLNNGLTTLSNAFIAAEFNWRSYATIQAALTANASTLFAKTGTHVLTAITNGGAPHILVLISMRSGYIGGVHQSYTSAPERIYSTDNGSTWTVG